jgi:hypothetical protein
MPRPNDALNEVFATYRWVPLTADDWFAAAIVGAMRTAVNDPIRQPIRDRHWERNLRNDTSGVLAELLLIRQVEQSLPPQPLRYQLLDLRGATDLLDVQTADSVAGLEAKSVLLLETPPRRDFAINAKAADRSGRRGAMGYVGVLMAMGSASALMSRVVPMDEVKGWTRKTYPGHDDPAHAIDLEDFAVRHAGLPADRPLSVIEDHLRRPPVVAFRDIDDVYTRAHTVMSAQRDLEATMHATSVASTLRELVRTLAAQGEALDGTSPDRGAESRGD